MEGKECEGACIERHIGTSARNVREHALKGT